MYNIKGFGRIRMQARTRKGGWRQRVKYESTEQAEIIKIMKTMQKERSE